MILGMDYLEIVNKIGKKITDYFFDRYKEKKNFINARNSIINNGQIQEIIAKDELTKIVGTYCDEKLYKELKKSGAIQDIKNIYKSLFIKLKENGIDHFISKYIAINTIYNIISECEKHNNYPIIDKDKISKYLEEEKNIYKDLIKNELRIQTALSKEIEGIYSIIDIDNLIDKQTFCPRLDIDFFKTDDYEFVSNFNKALDQDIISVFGRNKEETLLYTLNQLLQTDYNSKVFVVMNHDKWVKLIKTNVSGLVFIPFFSAKEIIPLQNNKTIYIRNENDLDFSDIAIELRKRTNRDLISYLTKYGLEHGEATKIVEDTNGFYYPMKKRISKSLSQIDRNTNEKYNKNILDALILCEKWTNNERDYYVIKQISDEEIFDIKNEIDRILNSNDEILLKYSLHGEEYYSLICFEDTWEINKKRINDTVYKRMATVYKYILFDNNVSERLKAGITNTLLVLSSLQKYERYNVIDYDKLINSIFELAHKENRFDDICRYFNKLCEISPKIFINIIISYIDENDINFINWYRTSSNYVYLLSAIEMLLLLDDCVGLAIETLFKLNEINTNHIYSNSAFETLCDAFCVWHNITSLSKNSKINMLGRCAEKYSNVNDIVYNLLPGIRTMMTGGSHFPKYREYEKPKEYTREDQIDLYYYYIDIYLMHYYDINNLSKIFNILYLLEDTKCLEVLEKVEIILTNLQDNEKSIIKERTREEIYKNRYYANADWSVDEKRISMYFDFFNKINFVDDLYNYLYLVDNDYQYKLLKPVTYDKENLDDSYRKKNFELINEDRINGFKEIKKKNLSLSEYILLVKNKENSQLGFCLAKYYDTSLFNQETLKELINGNCDKSIINEYVCTIYKQDKSVLTKAIEAIKKSSLINRDEIVSMIVKNENINNITNIKNALIENQTNEVKKYYWGSRLYYSYKTKELSAWALKECLKYGNVDNYLFILYESVGNYDENELFQFINNLSKMNIEITSGSMAGYYLSKCLKIISKYNINGLNIIEKLSYIELLFNNYLEWDEMIFTKQFLEYSPKLIYELIYILYSKGKNRNSKLNFLTKDVYGLLMFKFKFCPAYINGFVEYDALLKWCSELKKALINQDNEDCYYRFLGMYLSYSPVGDDGLVPCESIRKIIENENNEELGASYRMTVFNNRGVYSSTAGKNEKELAIVFYDVYQRFKDNYPVTARIYKNLYLIYRNEEINERIEAEYDEI